MKRARSTSCAFSLVVLLVALGAPRPVLAGGFYLFDRGAVAVSRGGAFVAGADDADALYYNPSGLLSAGRQLQLDVAMPRIRGSFTRTDTAGNSMATVNASATPLPAPTIAYADNFGLRRWAFGAGVFVPSAVELRWPTTVNVNGTSIAAPQRYSLLSLNGTVLAQAAVGAAFDAGHGFSVGVSVGANVADFKIDTVVSGCDGFICTNFENPEFDSRVKLDSGIRLAPLAILGARYTHRLFTVGASFSTPYRYRGDLDLDAQIPSSPAFTGATIVTADGKSPRVAGDIRMPWIARVGVETRAIDHLRLELDYVAEGWKVQNELRFTPQDVSIRLVGGFVSFDLIPIVVPRQMRTTHSIRAGAQYSAGPVDIRAGLAFETSAFPSRTLSPLTLDSTKTILSAGGTVRVGDHVRLDLTFAYSIMRNPTVTDSIVRQPTAIQPLAGTPNIIGNGHYAMDAFYVGAGLRWQMRDAVSAAPLRTSPRPPPADRPTSPTRPAPSRRPTR